MAAALRAPCERASGSARGRAAPQRRWRQQRRATVAVKSRGGVREVDPPKTAARADEVANASPRPGSIRAALLEQGSVPYGEDSRRYRRTVYRSEDWLKHRSPTRLFRNLQGIFSSGVVRSLVTEVGVVTGVATTVVVWNALAGGYEDWSGAVHPALIGNGSEYHLLALPALPFTLSSPALGLLLVFRTNTSYARWSEARVAWGRVVSHGRSIMRQSEVWTATYAMQNDLEGNAEHEAARRAGVSGVCDAVWAFARCMQAQFLGPDAQVALRADLVATVGEERADELMRARNRPLRALAHLSRLMDDLPMDEKRRVESDKSVILMTDALETCERIFTSPVPLVYTRHTARFLSAWLLLVPLALYEPFAEDWNHIALVPASALMAIFLFGIEELAVQLGAFCARARQGVCGVPTTRVCTFAIAAPQRALTPARARPGAPREKRSRFQYFLSTFSARACGQPPRTSARARRMAAWHEGRGNHNVSVTQQSLFSPNCP